MFSDFRIETERLILRAFTMEDVSGFLEVVSQPEVMESLPEGVMSEERLRKALRWIVDCYEKNAPKKIVKLSVGVVDKRSKRIIGWVGLAPLECSPSEIEIYYELSAHHWGKGLATEFISARIFHILPNALRR
jgi:ribosomal-protein-alanine N-acetyltransferase